MLLIATVGMVLCELVAAQDVIREPQAVAVVSQALTVAGGLSAINAINDFSAKGDVTYYWAEQVKGAATVRGRGLHQFRLDASLADGQHSWLINGSTTYRKNPNGSTSPLPSQNSVRVATTTFPLLRLASALQDATTNIRDAGIVTHNGQQVHDIIIQKNFPIGHDPAGALSKITKAHVFIDPTTMTVQEIDDSAYALNGFGEYPHEMRFSNYKSVNGVLVPFSVTELIAGQRTMSLELTEANFNTGLTDADFE